MKKILLSVGMLLFIYSTTVAQNSKKEAKEKRKMEQFQQILDLVDAREYEFIGRKANPAKGRQVDLTTRANYLRISGDTATADMPYFGRAFSGGYSNSGGGIQFNGPMELIDRQQNDKKRRITLKFRVKGDSDTFTCTLAISSMESTSFTVISNTRQSINYSGYLKSTAKEN